MEITRCKIWTRHQAFEHLLRATHSGIGPAHCAALGAGLELVVLVFEQDVERGERSAGRCVNRNSWIVNRGNYRQHVRLTTVNGAAGMRAT